MRGFLGVSGGSGDLAGSDFTPATSTTAFNVTGGANYRVNETLTFGLAASIGNQNFDPAGGTIDATST